MRASTFGRQAMKDSAFVWRLRNTDKAVTTGTIEKVRNWMAENRHLLRQAAE